MLTFLFELVTGWFTGDVTDRITDPGSPATRAADAYESAWVLRNPEAALDEQLTAQLDRYEVAEQYADPESVIGQELFESYRAGVNPRSVKRWLKGLESH